VPTAEQPRILVIANRTASTPVMFDTIAERAQAGASFTLLIPPDHGQQDDSPAGCITICPIASSTSGCPSW
jgi:hypothetical protein